MLDANLLRKKISLVKSELVEIEKLLDDYDGEIDTEKRFYTYLSLPEDATGEDFFAVMPVISIAKNSIIESFLFEHEFYHRHTSKMIKIALRNFTAFYVYSWLRNIDQQELGRYRRIGRKGREQILKFCWDIDHACRKGMVQIHI